MEKFKALYHQNLPSIKASEELTSILNQQRNPKLKNSLGYEEGSSSDHPSNMEHIKFVKSTIIDNNHSAKQRKENSTQEGMKEKVPELIRETIHMKKIDPLREDNILPGTKVFSMDIVFSILTLVTKL